MARDQHIRRTLATLLNVTAEVPELGAVGTQVHLPTRRGGLGLHSAIATGPAAHWGSWADALPSLHERMPDFLETFRPAMVRLVVDGASLPPTAALRNLHEVALLLQSEGFSDLPTWSELLNNRTPTVDEDDHTEPGQVRKGWQREATKHRDNHSYATYFSTLGSTDRARLRSCAGPNSARWLSAIPFEKALRFDCPTFRVAVLRRLGLPVEMLADTCEGCGANLDEMGYHRTTCMRSGRVQTRHKPLIQIWRRIFREAGINISQRNTERTLATTHVRRSPDDRRRMDFLCPGVDGIYGGAPLFADVTMVSPLHGNGTPMPRSASEDGAAERRAAGTCRLTD